MTSADGIPIALPRTKRMKAWNFPIPSSNRLAITVLCNLTRKIWLFIGCDEPDRSALTRAQRAGEAPGIDLYGPTGRIPTTFRYQTA